MEYNGWKNKETWLVNIWYMDSMPEYFADSGQYHNYPLVYSLTLSAPVGVRLTGTAWQIT
jgi:hypothetical protein